MFGSMPRGAGATVKHLFGGRPPALPSTRSGRGDLIDVEGEAVLAQPVDEDLAHRRGRGADAGPAGHALGTVEGERQRRLPEHHRGAAVAGVVVRPDLGAVAPA